MKKVPVLVCLTLIVASMTLATAQTRQIPMRVTVSQDGKDTVVRATATVTTYSKSSTAETMKDTAYLRNLSGEYRIGFSTEIVTIGVTPTRTLQIDIPGRGRHDLLPIIRTLFNVKDLPGVKILVFIDRFGQSRGIDIIDEQEALGSHKRQISASKLGTFRN